MPETDKFDYSHGLVHRLDVMGRVEAMLLVTEH